MHLCNKICSITYELALLLTLLLVILAPIHAASTQHFTVVQKIDARHAVITGDMQGMHEGTMLKLYRFNPYWKLKLGNAGLEEIHGTEALISFDPLLLSWPVSTPNEYAYRTQATSFENRELSGLEIFLTLVIILTYFLLFFTYKESTFLRISKKIPEFSLPTFITLPFSHFWKFISYKNIGVIKHVTWKRGLSMWALHLIIVYVFGSTLFGFLRGNIQAIKFIGWPVTSYEMFFELAKYYTWSFTIVGCLIGYAYSICSILWGKYIRNLDFTVTGWVTNGLCYPFLGVYIWQTLPSFTGPDPIITDGPLFLLMLVMGLVLNMLYMLTIWNLGTMFGVMTDKGVRKSGFYSVVRHPSYTLEVLMFFVTELIGLTSGIHWLVISTYFFIYWIRSEREDNFMLYSNPEFEAYTKAVPYKFIPGIY